jgi:hypothetical protein
MATPGYPQMQQGPMGGMGPGMGGPPMQRPPRPARRGTSRAVPVVVSAGLAVGVFCGLLFGLGTGADAKPASGSNTNKHQDDDSTVTPVYANTPATTKLANSGSGSGSGGGIGSATIAMAGGSGSGSAMAVAPKLMKVTIKIDPDAAGSAATITIDGKAITGTSADVAPDTKQIHVQVTATGYHSYDAKVDVAGQAGDEHTINVALTKRSTSSSGTSSPGFGGASTGGNHVPTAPPKPKTKPNTGIIDI